MMVKKFEYPTVDEKDVPIEALLQLKQMLDASSAGAPANLECWTPQGMFGLNRHSMTFYKWAMTDEDV